MSADLVENILAAAHQAWHWSNDIEITLEANPTSVETDKLQAFQAAGINRVSLGLQALNDTDLRKLGRMHSASEGIAAMQKARDVFDRVSFDLIYARQDQTLKEWSVELEQALSFDPSHLSLYQLTIEPETVFGQRHALGQLKGLPDEDAAADMYFETQAMCEASGLPAYEISNHAKPDYPSEHNLIYWRGGDYIGIGPGAHGRFDQGDQRWATETHLMPAKWLAAVVNSGSGHSSQAVITRQDQANEYLMMSLRLSEGMSLDRFERLNGLALSPTKVIELEELGLVHVSEGRLIATAQGRPILNALIRELLVT